MNETRSDLGKNGQLDLADPAVARMLLAWIGGLGDCVRHEALARRAALSARTLARFAAGEAGRGGPKTLASLLAVVRLFLWVAGGVMLPVLRAVAACRRHRRAGEDIPAARGALELAGRVAWLELVARQGAGEPGESTAWTGLHPDDARVLIACLQALGDWTRRELACRAGISHESLRLYEIGERPLQGPAVRSLAMGAGVPLWLVEGLLLPALRAVRRLAAHPRGNELAAAWAAGSLAPVPARRPDEARIPAGWPVPAPADREAADELWRRLRILSPAGRVRLVKAQAAALSWATVERLCTASRKAATSSAREALRLALLALQAARLVNTEPLLALQLEGFALVHVANAWRVRGRLRQADEVYARGLLYWKAGEGTRFPVLPGWRLLDLGGSLRRDQQRFDEAIDFLDRALEAAPREVWGRILLNKATVLDLQGKPAEAVAVLDEAAKFDVTADPALAFRWRSTRASALYHLGRYREAEDLMPETIALAAVHGQELDHLRLEGLRGQIAAALGRREEALAAFNTTREEFRRRKMAFDFALASLEAAGLLLQEKRYDEVQALALEMEWIFTQEGVPEETARALDLFRKAAEGRTATVELAGRVVRFLYKAQHNPELAFAA